MRKQRFLTSLTICQMVLLIRTTAPRTQYWKKEYYIWIWLPIITLSHMFYLFFSLCIYVSYEIEPYVCVCDDAIVQMHKLHTLLCYFKIHSVHNWIGNGAAHHHHHLRMMMMIKDKLKIPLCVLSIKMYSFSWEKPMVKVDETWSSWNSSLEFTFVKVEFVGSNSEDSKLHVW